MKRFFPKLNQVNLNNLMIDDIGEYSITRPEEAELITDIIIRESKSTDVILDGMAGTGGNTISFCNYFKNVISVENDISRFNILNHNLKQYQFTNYKTYYDDCLNIIDEGNYNIIFFDPPWGGKNYLKREKVELSISGFKIWMIIKYILKENNGCNIFLKIPSNFDLIKLKEELLISDNIKIFKFEIGKFLLLKIYLEQ
jgi:trimethylguanosine synthase